MKRYDINSYCGCRLCEEESEEGSWVGSSEYDRILAQRDRLLDAARKAAHRIGYAERFDAIGSDRLDALCELDDLVAELDKEKQS